MSETLIETGSIWVREILDFLKAAISGHWVQDRSAWHGISSREISGPVASWRSEANVFLFSFWHFGILEKDGYELKVGLVREVKAVR